MNSVDFLFEIGEDGTENLYLYDRGKKRLMDNNRVTFGDDVDPSTYSGKIVECSFDSEENIWVCMRVRIDKNTPNEFKHLQEGPAQMLNLIMSFRGVMKSIKDNITEEVLLNEIGEIIRLPMYADRIQSDSRAMKKGKPPPQRSVNWKFVLPAMVI
uniref:mRNA capping enzyme C-terminal domain-containing protein n=1 Tax=Chenopodium quinoa TaxID=63459 RepID=A0A803NBI1_CHEQI